MKFSSIVSKLWFRQEKRHICNGPLLVTLEVGTISFMI